MPLDRETLDQIETLFLEKSVTPFDEDYNTFVESLSFSRTRFDDVEPTELKRAWTNFLHGAFESNTSWEWPCNVGMAKWYSTHEKPLHAIAVYEHLLREIHRRGLNEAEGEYCGELQEWLQRLFHLCQRQGLTERALHVAGLIGDFQEEGVIDHADYAEVIASIPTLRRREAREYIEKERAEADRHYREDFADLITKLHDDTKRCLVQAEVMSAVSIRHIDPSAAPLCWSLAIESEFHHRVYEVRKHRLDGILGETRRPKGRRTCGIGQMLVLVKETCSDPIKRPLVEREIPAWRKLLAVPDIVETLNVIKEHRDQIAHVTERGMYTQARCSEFVRRIRESGWIINFMQAIQPAS
ncbi:MAG: hypothetical protein EWM73_01439 [Nitrospira sp.]|nr:MAG: hypothetical protein EWM73_01439 [Nitrospira sp.]